MDAKCALCMWIVHVDCRESIQYKAEEIVLALYSKWMMGTKVLYPLYPEVWPLALGPVYGRVSHYMTTDNQQSVSATGSN